MSLLSNPKLKSIFDQVATELELPEFTVHEVVRHQFKSAQENLPKQKSVEITGLCYFTLRDKQVTKHLDKFTKILQAYEKQLITATDNQKQNLYKRIESCNKEIDYLKTKLKNEQ